MCPPPLHPDHDQTKMPRANRVKDSKKKKKKKKKEIIY